MNPALIVCEESGTVREAFRRHGVECFSCDLQPSRDASPFHIQADMREVIPSRPWSMIGMHPVCKYLTGSGIHWNNRGRGWDKTNEALELVRWLMSLDCPWYLENPTGLINSKIRKPDQIIQPYQFGDDASKGTCLWLNRLPPLVIDPGQRCPGRMVEWPKGSGKQVERWSNQTDSGQNKLGPSPTRERDRSKTYPGIAEAMAATWAPVLIHP